MMCSNCGKQEANFMYTEIINGVKKEVRLCTNCANKLGFLDIDMSLNMPGLDFSNFFGDFLSEYDSLMPSMFSEKAKVLKCSECGMDYDEFLNLGRFGCSNCYDIFQEKIEPLLRQLHGDTRYSGKKSKNSLKSSKNNSVGRLENSFNVNTEYKKDFSKSGLEVNNRMDILKDELKQAIKVENYEEAARIRDEIKALEENEITKHNDKTINKKSNDVTLNNNEKTQQSNEDKKKGEE